MRDSHRKGDHEPLFPNPLCVVKVGSSYLTTMNKSHAAHVVKPKRADRLQSTKCQPRATRPQVPFQGPSHGLVFYLDDGVNGTTIPQTQQTQHAHIMRVHLAGCCKGQAQQHEINLGRAPRAYVVKPMVSATLFLCATWPPRAGFSAAWRGFISGFNFDLSLQKLKKLSTFDLPP